MREWVKRARADRTHGWKKTNVQTHITHVLWSGRTTEIKALKIWKRLRRLDFLSFYVELFAIGSDECASLAGS